MRMMMVSLLLPFSHDQRILWATPYNEMAHNSWPGQCVGQRVTYKCRQKWTVRVLAKRMLYQHEHRRGHEHCGHRNWDGAETEIGFSDSQFDGSNRLTVLMSSQRSRQISLRYLTNNCMIFAFSYFPQLITRHFHFQFSSSACGDGEQIGGIKC